MERPVGLAEDIRLVNLLLRKRGNVEQRRWFAAWCQKLVAAAAAGDEQGCRDLHDALRDFCRTELEQPARHIDVNRLLRDLGLSSDKRD
jgi:hypothetical protein